MDIKKFFIGLIFITSFSRAQAQTPVTTDPLVDTLFTDYDALFSELDLFLDSITAPRSFTLVNFGIGNGYFSYTSSADRTVKPLKKWFVAPSIAYYDKSGLGISIGTSIIEENGKLNPYQYSFSGSYDYMGNRKFITGMSFTHFVMKPDLGFYTSPLQNEVFGYFAYRKSPIKPSIGVSYGWGSRTKYEEVKEKKKIIQAIRNAVVQTSTVESISDFNITASVRRDFYLLNVLKSKDFFRITPQFIFISGTQQFGFNQKTNTLFNGNGNAKNSQLNLLNTTENMEFDNTLRFQPLSLAANLKLEYSMGKFFIQPQYILSYYFPAQQNNISNAVVINTGFIF